MKITEYPEVRKLTEDNVLLVDGDNGTKKVFVGDAIMEMLHLTSAELHRMIFRGKNLGSALTEEQKNAIHNGTFEDLWLGDYWEIEGRIWRIVDFDYWLHCGDTAFESHHLVVMPDKCLYTTQMNTSNVTTGAYVGSAMYTSNLKQAKTIVTAAFGNAVLTHREFLANAVTNGRPSAGAWYDSTVELPNECMMYGHLHFSPTSDGTNVPYTYTISKTQLALMMVYPEFINPARENQWLRDVVSAACFAFVNGDGRTAYANASTTLGVRPVIAIG